MSSDHQKITVDPVYADRFRKLARQLGKPGLVKQISPRTPWVCFSNEFGVSDLSAAGGLGYLAGDWVLLAGKLGIPFIGVGLYYAQKWRQQIRRDFLQQEKVYDTLEPEHYSFRKLTGNGFEIPELVSNGNRTRLDVYVKSVHGNLLLMLHESGLKGLYEGAKESEHRLYQATALGFAGAKTVISLGYDCSILHLNESTTVFAALAMIDHVLQNGTSLKEALKTVSEKTIFTNHTLSPAAEPAWTEANIRKYVLGNIDSEELRSWLLDVAADAGGKLRLSTLAMQIAGHINAVSKLHARKVRETYKRRFTPVTNAIANRWIYPEILQTYKELAIGDPVIDLLPEDYRSRLFLLESDTMQEIKDHAKEDLCNYLLAERKDQYDKPVAIPEDARIVVWARRFDSYKRPGLLFSDPERLASLCERYDFHILLSGKAHPVDKKMKQLIKRLLTVVDNHPVLKKRVHFIVNYNWQLTRHLGGADIMINTPVVGWEACGTSWEKAVANWLMLCTTPDGGPADVLTGNSYSKEKPPFFMIRGRTDDTAATSLYTNLNAMGEVLDDPARWRKMVIRQLTAFLPTISGTRMMLEYLDLRFGT